MKVIIAGGRTFKDYELLRKVCTALLCQIPKVEITVLCGMAKGADELGYKFAQEFGLTVMPFPADWVEHGRKAGYLRNRQMEQEATHLIAFWDYKSKGTSNMIDLMRKSNKPVHIERY